MFEARSMRGKLLLQLVLTVLAIPFLLPLIVMVQGSLAGLGWRNYRIVLSVPEVPLFFRNTILMSGITIVVVYCLTMLAAFGFAKMRIWGKQFFFWALLVALTLPEVVLITPLFISVAATGLYDTIFAVLIPLAALQIPFTVLLTRTFVEGIPDSLMEAARIDGASTWQAFWHMILPLTRPIGAAIIMLTLISSWNTYLLPLLFLSDPSSQVLTQLPGFFQGLYNDDQTKVLASAVITAAPIIVAYLCLQKLFERGLAAGALK